MTYKITDEFLDKVDALLDAVMEASQYSDSLDGAGVTLVNLEKFERMKERFIVLCNAMDDGFPEYGKDDGDEKETEKCADPGDSDPAAVFDDPDGAGCASDDD
ncbi:hypothetical protein [Acidaminococcus timonensis]|uniref:hypothetical protein n=1 Tax=Acidaminococcus timonensis TaxID=1871002 RepID=UPI003076C7EF